MLQFVMSHSKSHKRAVSKYSRQFSGKAAGTQPNECPYCFGRVDQQTKSDSFEELKQQQHVQFHYLFQVLSKATSRH